MINLWYRNGLRFITPTGASRLAVSYIPPGQNLELELGFEPHFIPLLGPTVRYTGI